MRDEVIYFSVNNWFAGRDYPNTPTFREWMKDDLNLKLRDDDWAKENKLCIYYGVIDMSQNFTVSAPKEWVEKNCPEIIGSEFEYKPRSWEYVPSPDKHGMPFQEYKECNFGSSFYDTEYWDDDEDEEEDEEELDCIDDCENDDEDWEEV